MAYARLTIRLNVPFFFQQDLLIVHDPKGGIFHPKHQIGHNKNKSNPTSYRSQENTIKAVPLIIFDEGDFLFKSSYKFL